MPGTCESRQRSLSESIIIHNHSSGRLKSCPQCSNSEGKHVFYAYESFGMRTMEDGSTIVQSWCPGCRSNAKPQTQPIATC
ncbi:hypothetical protein OJHNALOF_02868 [Oceanimonas sp. MB9]|nr:hypothetical protein [Oceanimonas sp. MB9]